MTIDVKGTIDIGDTRVGADKTIFGLGVDAKLIGSLGLYATHNVIVQNLTLTNPDGDGEGDCVTLKNGTRDVWVDHCTLVDGTDGELDITRESDFVTVSWSKFYYTRNNGHNFSMLIGNSDSAMDDSGKLHVTLHHNYWGDGAIERMPRVRFGQVHSYNNYFNTPGDNYNIRAAIGSQLLIQNNSFENTKDPYVIYVTTGAPGRIKASGNQFVKTIGTIDDGNDIVFTPPYAYTLDAASAVKERVTSGAGAGRLGGTPPTPSAWIKLDETTGLTALDSVSGATGTLQNMEPTDWTAGRINNGLAFDGVNESVRFGNRLNYTKNFTIAAWIKPAATDGYRGLVGKLTDANDRQYQLSVHDGRLNFQYERSGNHFFVEGGTIAANAWQHVAVTISPTRLITLYVNGKAVASATAPKETVVHGDSLYLGRWGGGYPNYFKGVLDDVRFYDTALAAADVATLAAATADTPSVAWSVPAPPAMPSAVSVLDDVLS